MEREILNVGYSVDKTGRTFDMRSVRVSAIPPTRKDGHPSSGGGG
jgi:hypothetical protein